MESYDTPLKNKNRGLIKVGKFFLFFFLLEIIIYCIVSTLNVSDPALLNSFKNERNNIDASGFFPMVISIFSNNFKIASIEAIPVVGPFFFLIVSYDTAFVLALEGTSAGVSGFFYLLTLFLLPDTWLEIPAYGISSAIGTYFLYRLFTKRDQIRQTLLKIVLLYGFVALELFVAASFESYEIILERSNKAPYDLLYPLMMWIPAIPSFVVLIYLFRRIDIFSKDRENVKNETDPLTQ